MEIEARMAAPGFWDNQEKAQLAVGQLKSLKTIIRPLEETLQSCEDLTGLLEMAAEDEGFATEVTAEISRLESVLKKLELAAMLDGPNDAAGALISIYARDGGTDANDWAEMMLRMYTQWAQKNGYSCSLMDRQDDEVAGISNASIAIRGPMAYGYRKGETGVHRLVLISPYNADGKRQTSLLQWSCHRRLPRTPKLKLKRAMLAKTFFAPAAQVVNT